MISEILQQTLGQILMEILKTQFAGIRKQLNSTQSHELNNQVLLIMANPRQNTTGIIILLCTIVILAFCACKDQSSKIIIAKFKNGNIAVEKVYPKSSNKGKFRKNVYFPDGKLNKTALVSGGRYVGEKITYFRSGKIFQVDSLSIPCDTTSDACDGILKRYYENGKLSQRYTVKNNSFNGVSEHFDTNGVLVKRYVLKNDSLKDGLYEEFYDDGVISLKMNFVNGTEVGYAYFFDEKGDTLKYYNTFKGKMAFPYKKWLANGNILLGDFADSKKNVVKWTWRNNKGKIIRIKISRGGTSGFVAPD